MSVGKNDGPDTVPILGQIRDVGNDDIDAEQFGFGEHEARIDDDDVFAPAYGHAVHSKLAQTAQGYDLQFSSWHQEVP